jgi:predicted small integral membrane protein
MPFSYVKFLSMIGLSCYLMIATWNNFVDQKTNQFLLGQMFSMSLIKDQSDLGQGLIPRAIESKEVPRIVLDSVIVIESLITLMLWLVSLQLMYATLFHKARKAKAIAHCNLALVLFMALWFFFWCGGLWFGYWIKTGQIQGVHMQLIVISLLELILINMNKEEEA